LFTHPALSQTHFNKPVINKYSAVVTIKNDNHYDKDTVTVTNPEHFKPGDFVLFIVMKGVDIYTPDEYPANPDFWGKILNINNTGAYSINPVENVENNQVILTTPLQNINPMKSGEMAQLIHIPVVQTAIFDTVITCKQWDHQSGTGGVLVLMATKKIVMNNKIDVCGKGFRGANPGNDYFMGTCSAARDSFYTVDAVNSAGLKGEGIVYKDFPYQRGFWYVANAGGGGNGKYSGGGGGGNHGPGGWAGKELESCYPMVNYGGGGRHIPSDFFTNVGSVRNRLFMGGGGGTSTQNPDSGRFATPGGNGGGLVILIADTLQTFYGDTICASGESVKDTATAGAGGGGAGGMVVVDVSHYFGNLHIDVHGGSGGLTNAPDKTGPGGFGGGGFIWFSRNKLPINVTIDTSNGKAGVWLPGNAHYGAITSSQLSGNALGELILPLTGTLFNNLPDKYVYCTEEITDQLPASAPKGGFGDYTFLWQQSEDKKNWSTADGEYDLMRYAPSTKFDTMYFRRIVSSGPIDDTSNIITVLQLPPIINNIIKGGGIICENQPPDPVTQGDLPLTGGTGSYTYLWQILTKDGCAPAPAINNNTEYVPQPLSENTIFIRLVRSDDCISYSNEVEFEVRLNPRIMESPVSDTINSGGSVIFHSHATGFEPIDYTWVYNNTVIEQATGTDLIIKDANSNNTGYYYCVAENDCGVAYSDSAYLLVIPGVSAEYLNEKTDKPVIYPNPASNRIYIDHADQGKNIMTIYAISGTRIKTLRNTSSIGLEDLSAGLYYLKIEYPGKSLVFFRQIVISP